MIAAWNVFQSLDWDKILKSWSDGGWIMIPLAAVGLVCYGSAIQILQFLWQRNQKHLTDEDMRAWVRQPNQAPGEVGEMLRYAQEDVDSMEELQLRFAEIAGTKIPEVDRRLAFVIVLVSAAPLMGLLGTVLGMLTTFEGIAAGGGRMVDGIARGISEALITTEMGLLIALPGLVLSYWVRRKRNDYVAFLARLESLTLQHHRRRFEGDDAPPAYRIQNTTPQRHRGGESELPSNLSPANA